MRRVLTVPVAFKILFILGIILPDGVNGYYLLSPPRALEAHELQHLAKRNLSSFLDNIPSQCNVQCDVIVGAAHVCVYLDCLCTADNSNALVTCVNCVVGLSPYSDGLVNQYQAILNEWKNGQCVQYYTPPMTVSYPTSASSSSSTPTSSPSPRPIMNDSISSLVSFSTIWIVFCTLIIIDSALLFLL